MQMEDSDMGQSMPHKQSKIESDDDEVSDNEDSYN